MLLSHIRKQIAQAVQNVKTIAPKIKSHMVVMTGHCSQFEVEFFEQGNRAAVIFHDTPGIFSKRPPQKLFDDFAEHQKLTGSLETLEKQIAKAGMSAKMREWVKFEAAFNDAYKKNDAAEIERLQIECAEKSKGAESSAVKKLESQKRQMEKTVTSLNQTLLAELEKQDFCESRCELRFLTVQIDAIQEIKMHPIIREIGKTDMSPVNIRVVVG